MKDKRDLIQQRYQYIMSNPGGYDADQEISGYSHVKAAYVGYLLRKHGVLPAAQILEVGVGTGLIAAPLVKSGWEVVGIDVSDDMLRAARQRFQVYSIQKAHIAKADGFVLPFADNQFHAVIAIQVLHLFEPKERQLLLHEFLRVTRPGGVVVVDLLQRLAHFKKWWRTRHRRPHRYEPPSRIRETFAFYPQVSLEGGLLPFLWKIHRLERNSLFKPFVLLRKAPLLRWLAHSHFAVISKLESSPASN